MSNALWIPLNTKYVLNCISLRVSDLYLKHRTLYDPSKKVSDSKRRSNASWYSYTKRPKLYNYGAQSITVD
jgi:hypothetical protein